MGVEIYQTGVYNKLANKIPRMGLFLKPGIRGVTRRKAVMEETKEKVTDMTEKDIFTAETKETGEVCPGCRHKTKKRTGEERKSMINRLNRIEGQIRGIRRMVEEDAYCPDILIQVSAANAALNSFNKELLASHIKTCVADDIRNGKDETIDELVITLQKLMK